MNTSTTPRIPRLSRTQRLKAKSLLAMEYRPSEIADILGIHVDTICRSLLPAGCPHRRDEKGDIWIIGTELSAWIQQLERPKNPLGPDQAFCLSCRAAVVIQKPLTIQPTSRVLELITGKCPKCGKPINRARARHIEVTNDNPTD
ncbi:MAG: hypothetical protein BWY63_00687 [Chloroflexi bacterium ADurb.Bin360]|nr:MAG: hypothetical protein BWY63_00687 [Chloroflexi bacterium ADurb.Bin360]